MSTLSIFARITAQHRFLTVHKRRASEIYDSYFGNCHVTVLAK